MVSEDNRRKYDRIINEEEFEFTGIKRAVCGPVSCGSGIKLVMGTLLFLVSDA
jgi:hypothetical protein